VKEDRVRGVAGQKCIVTGAGQGIGRATALRLAREGADVMIAELNPETAERVAAEVRALGRQGQARRVLDITEEDWDRMLDVNVKGLFFCLQAAARQMIKQGVPEGAEVAGKIINISSNAGRSGRPLLLHYAASKAAVISITQGAAQAFARDRVLVNAVCPGVLGTAFWEKLDREWSAIEGWEPGEAWRRRIATIPLGRPQEPDDVAGVIAFLASRDADYITGQAYNVCGGLVMN